MEEKLSHATGATPRACPKYAVYAWAPKPGFSGTPQHKKYTRTKAAGAREFIRLKRSGKYSTIEFLNYHTGDLINRYEH